MAKLALYQKYRSSTFEEVVGQEYIVKSIRNAVRENKVGHGGVEVDQLTEENVEAMLKGTDNLQKHIESIQAFGVPYVVAINKFSKDTPAEVAALLNWCKEHNHPVAEADGWAKGGAGMKEKVADYNKLQEEIKSLTEQGKDVKALNEELNQKYLELLYSNPAGFRITAKMSTNYRALKTIYHQRKDHSLPEWRAFCEWVKTLPHSEFITGEISA